MSTDIATHNNTQGRRQQTAKRNGQNVGAADDVAARTNDFESLWDYLGLSREWRSSGQWSAYLRKRKKPRSAAQLFGAGKSRPVLWGVRSTLDPQPAIVPIRTGAGVSRRQSGDDKTSQPKWSWPELSGQTSDLAIANALSTVDLAQHIKTMITELSDAEWWQLLNRLVQASDWARSAEFTCPWLYQLLRIELPLTLGHQFPEFIGIVPDMQDTAADFERALARWLDDYGLPPSGQLLDFRGLIFGWLRSAILARSSSWGLGKTHGVGSP